MCAMAVFHSPIKPTVNDVSDILQAYINCRSSLKLELNCSAYGPVTEQHVGMHWNTMVGLLEGQMV